MSSAASPPGANNNINTDPIMHKIRQPIPPQPPPPPPLSIECLIVLAPARVAVLLIGFPLMVISFCGWANNVGVLQGC